MVTRRILSLLVMLAAVIALPVAFISDSAHAAGAGGHIAFGSDRDGDWDIYVMNPDGSNVRQLTLNTDDDFRPAWSPDGRQIAFHSDRDGDYEIYVMNADGSNVRQLTFNTAADVHAAWSPDGTRIAYQSSVNGLRDIYVVYPDGTNPRLLTNNALDDWFPAWSPDSNQIVTYAASSSIAVFVGQHGAGSMEYHVNDLPDVYLSCDEIMNSTQFQPLAVFVGASNQAVNAAAYHAIAIPGQVTAGLPGAWLFRVADLGGCEDRELTIMNADGSASRRLTNNFADDRYPAWSPDGTRIAFASDLDSDFEIYLFDLRTNNIVQITANRQTDWAPAWSPDSTQIVFSSDRDGDNEVYIMNVDGSNVVQLTFNAAQDELPAWSPW
ncbi:MAG: PD40 domain-containing protein [Anaerolineae bacterium]|nr:PD40 domain-containing protein [Anaerolineae bacterium]